MVSTNRRSAHRTSSARSLVVLVVCLLAIGASGYYIYRTSLAPVLPPPDEGPVPARSVHQSPGARDRQPPASRPDTRPPAGPPSRQQRQQMFDSMLSSLDLTPAQRQQIDQLGAPPENREGFRQRHEQLREILTEQQLEQLHQQGRQMMRRHFEERLEGKLSEADREILRQRFEQRMRHWRDRRAPPRGRRDAAGDR